jgi:hypothetical protein
VLLQEATDQPMRELLAFLKDNGFKTYICSGGGIEFLRVVSQEISGIPPEQVIGSAGFLEFRERDGKAVLVKLPKLLSFNDKQGKPAGIALHIGRVPIFAAGNVRTGGDIAMLRTRARTELPGVASRTTATGDPLSTLAADSTSIPPGTCTPATCASAARTPPSWTMVPPFGAATCAFSAT